MELTRRSLVATFAAGAAGLAVGCGGDRRPRRRRREAVVVGAGLAGLAAARELEALGGWRVTVLERAARAGGRVRTERFAEGQHAEAGGEFLDTGHRRMLGLVDALGLELEDVRESGSDGEEVVRLAGFEGTMAEARARVGEELDRVDAAVARLASRIDPTDPARSAFGRRLDRRSAASLLDGLALSPLARALAEAEIRDEHLVEPERLSLLWLAQSAAATAGQPDAGVEAFRVRGGNDRVPLGMVAELRGEVARRAPVAQVRPRGGRVELRAAGESLFADAAIVAVPLAEVARLGLLPARTSGTAYGVGAKTMLAMRSRAWEDAGGTGDSLTDLAFGSSWDATSGQRGERGILLAYTAGARAGALARLGLERRVERVVAAVAEVFPAVPDAISASRTRVWEHAYLSPAPGQVAPSWRALRRPAAGGRIRFCGEHTATTLVSYMEGAVESGRREARRLHARRALL